jgi:hypothetical protein
VKKKGALFIIPVCLCFLIIPAAVHGQTSTSAATDLQSTQFDTSDFPLWAKDLRRAEIVAFGSFPFTFFFATFAMDTYRYASHNQDIRYAPWPFKPSGAIDMTQNELILTMSIAAVGSVVVSCADYFIVKYKRHKQRQEMERLTGDTPIILRTPHGGRGGVPGEEDALSGEAAEVPAEIPAADPPGSGEIAPPGAAPETP